MADKPDDLFAKYLDPYVQRIEERARSLPDLQNAANVLAAFESQWHGIYGDPDAALIAERLIGMADGIEQRFWDFEIPMLFQESTSQSFNVSHNLAVAALIYACKRNHAAIVDGLSRALLVPNDIAFWHSRIYEHLVAFVRPPLTPPVTEARLAAILGVDRHAINNQWRRGEWEAIGPKGFRRWGHKDRDRQLGVLQAFRNNFPEKFWLDLRRPPTTNA